MTTNNHTPIPSSPKQPANAATINAPLGQLDAAVGDLSTLTTTAKTSAVAAINEANHGFGSEPPAVSSSTSGSAGTAATAARSDHSHDLGTHAHASAANGGQIDAVDVVVTNLPANLMQVGDYLLGLRNGVASKVALGAGNGVDVDMLDGNHASAFATAGHGHAHSALSLLLNDDHTQYPLLAGRAGGQTIIGGTASGNSLTLQSTSHATKGKINIGGSSAYDEVNNRLGIGIVNPISAIDVQGTNTSPSSGSDLIINGEFDSSTDWIAATGWAITNSGYYKFTVSNVTILPQPGATYTNNGQTFTINCVTFTGSPYSGILYCTGTGNPSASGTLTKASGIGDTTMSFSAFAANNVAVHTTGNATSLTKTLPLINGAYYQISFLIYTTTIGALTPKAGTSTSNSIYIGAQIGTAVKHDISANNGYFEILIVSNGTNDIVFTADATWAGWIDLVVVKQITPATAVQNWRDSSGNIKSQTFANGAYNLFFGATNAGAFIQSGSYNISYGDSALRNVTSGTYNTAFGYGALFNNTIGSANVAIGALALIKNIAGINNVAIGNSTLFQNTFGDRNIAIGLNALNANTIGRNNTAIGIQALQSTTTGTGNIAIGPLAAVSNTIGTNNVAIGNSALYTKTSGDSNTAVGMTAGYSLTTGSNNTFIGAAAGFSNTGSNNVCIGYNAGYSETGSNKLHISNSNTATPLIGGDFSAKYVTIDAKIVLTPDGGFAVRVIAGEALARGEVIYSRQTGGASGKVYKNPIDGDMPLGVVYADAVLDAEVWVVTSGMAYILPNTADTAAIGYVIYASSTTAGRVSQSSTAPAATTHFRECGHWIDSGSGAGAITRAIVHFN